MKRLAMYLVAAYFVAATVALAGCGSSPTGTPAAAVSPCATAQLAASLGQSDGAAGTIYYPLNLRNISSSTCRIAAYADVSFVSGPDGQQVGQAASHDNSSTSTVTLSSGQTASATLGIVEAGNFPSDCNMTSASGLRVSLPGETGSLVIDHANTACANPNYTTLHVGPFANA